MHTALGRWQALLENGANGAAMVAHDGRRVHRVEWGVRTGGRLQLELAVPEWPVRGVLDQPLDLGPGQRARAWLRVPLRLRWSFEPAADGRATRDDEGPAAAAGVLRPIGFKLAWVGDDPSGRYVQWCEARLGAARRKARREADAVVPVKLDNPTAAPAVIRHFEVRLEDGELRVLPDRTVGAPRRLRTEAPGRLRERVRAFVGEAS